MNPEAEKNLEQINKNLERLVRIETCVPELRLLKGFFFYYMPGAAFAMFTLYGLGALSRSCNGTARVTPQQRKEMKKRATRAPASTKPQRKHVGESNIAR